MDFLGKDFPPFESVYDWVEGFGRTKSPSYRMYRGARRMFVPNPPPEGVSPKKEKRKFKYAVNRLKLLRRNGLV